MAAGLRIRSVLSPARFLIAVPLILSALPASAAGAALSPCRLPGVEYDALCGTLQRPLDPAAPQGTKIDLHFAVLPALARQKKPDPVFFFAGGPGQSAIDLAGPVSRMLARLANRRDLVLIDQRGTGRSAPLVCDPPSATRPLREVADPARQREQLVECRKRLQALPYGDLRQFTTTIAMQDADAVRQALGAERINAVGGSYGTRAVLEYQRQFPQAVRRSVIDGVAPADMALPAAFSGDAQTAFDALLAACQAEAGCAARHPALQAQWRALLASLPRELVVVHPVTGRDERLTMTREMLTGMVRGPLYSPVLTSALPFAIGEAAAGRFAPLIGLSSALVGNSRSAMIAMGMHFSVVCAEDAPRSAASADRPGADFGGSLSDLYARVCADWPRGVVPPAFYSLPVAATPVLAFSGGIDPVTPPRHGERVTQALGAKARHVVVPNAGHGLLSLPCVRDVVFRFIDADSDDAAAKVDAGCAAAIPRPPAFAPVSPVAASGVPK